LRETKVILENKVILYLIYLWSKLIFQNLPLIFLRTNTLYQLQINELWQKNCFEIELLWICKCVFIYNKKNVWERLVESSLVTQAKTKVMVRRVLLKADEGL
jgi:hypothetical protein